MLRQQLQTQGSMGLELLGIVMSERQWPERRQTGERRPQQRIQKALSRRQRLLHQSLSPRQREKHKEAAVHGKAQVRDEDVQAQRPTLRSHRPWAAMSQPQGRQEQMGGLERQP